MEMAGTEGGRKEGGRASERMTRGGGGRGRGGPGSLQLEGALCVSGSLPLLLHRSLRRRELRCLPGALLGVLCDFCGALGELGVELRSGSVQLLLQTRLAGL